MRETEELNLQRWLREERQKDNEPHYPDYFWYQDWTRQAPLSEVMEAEYGRK